MGNKLYVGNLPYSARDDDLHNAFSQFGTVASAKVMMERDSSPRVPRASDLLKWAAMQKRKRPSRA